MWLCDAKRWHFALVLILVGFLASVFSQDVEDPVIVKKAWMLLEQETMKGNMEFLQMKDLPATKKLYNVAKIWQADPTLETDAWELFEFLADSHQHVFSLAKLGFKYAQQGLHMKSLRYFQLAGEYGPHHASLFNSGRILADLDSPDLPTALAYLRSASTLHHTHAAYAQESITKVSLEAYDILSRQIASTETTLQQSAHCFLYGALHDVPDAVAELWRDGMLALIQYNTSFVESNGSTQDMAALLKAKTALRTLWENHAPILSLLQGHLVLVHMNKILDPLAVISDDYVPMAAGYAEALAMSPYCFSLYTARANGTACFNGAVSKATAYYRRIDDNDAIERVFELAKSHPSVATNPNSILQTL